MPKPDSRTPIYVQFGTPPCHGWCHSWDMEVSRDVVTLDAEIFGEPQPWAQSRPSRTVEVTLAVKGWPRLTYQEWPRLIRPSYVYRAWPTDVVKPILIEIESQKLEARSARVGHATFGSITLVLSGETECTEVI